MSIEASCQNSAGRMQSSLREDVLGYDEVVGWQCMEGSVFGRSDLLGEIVD